MSRWWEFLWHAPRNANSEGRVFPAIFGTVVITSIMSVARFVSKDERGRLQLAR